jgi:hypothetical protein
LDEIHNSEFCPKGGGPVSGRRFVAIGWQKTLTASVKVL